MEFGSFLGESEFKSVVRSSIWSFGWNLNGFEAHRKLEGHVFFDEAMSFSIGSVAKCGDVLDY